MRKLFLLAILAAGVSFAQTAGQPACQQSFGPWTDTNSTNIFYNAANTQCAYWVMTYQVSGFSAISIQFESATGTNSGPGAFGLFSGTTVSGSNPSTSVTCSTPANCTLVVSGVVGWYRIRFTSHTGSGSIQGTLQGYKAYTALGGNTPVTSSSCPGTVGTPCVVVGPTAAGSPPTTAPVLQGGSDGTNTQTVRTDTTGRQIAVGAAAAGAAAAGNPVLVGGTDGANARTLLVSANGRADVNQQTAATAQADGNSNTAQTVIGDQGSPAVQQEYPFAFNGTTWDRQRAAALANMPTAQTTTAVNSIGAAITERGARWVVNSHPATSSQATATIAAEANVRHVADCVTFSATAGGAVTAISRFVSLRDGATGAGTILIQWTVAFPTAAATGIQEVAPQSFCGLNLVGTTNTAMTFEFDGGTTNVIETVSISGYNVN